MKTIMARSAAVSFFAAGLFLAGCSILAPQPDMSHFFTLAPLAEATVQPDASGADTSSTMLLGLGPIKLPPYLDRHEIAVRLSPTQITYSSVDRWAEPLNVSVSRVLLQNLSHLLGTERIAMYPWSNAAQVDYQIEVELLNFEVTQQGEARLLARYGIYAGGTRRVLLVREASISRPTATDAATSVAALSTTLGELSQEIAAAVRQLPKPLESPPAKRRKS
jgi:uncharacterized lipoprotein YmbA